jgi:hypothetical protein
MIDQPSKDPIAAQSNQRQHRPDRAPQEPGVAEEIHKGFGLAWSAGDLLTGVGVGGGAGDLLEFDGLGDRLCDRIWIYPQFPQPLP